MTQVVSYKFINSEIDTLFPNQVSLSPSLNKTFYYLKKTEKQYILEWQTIDLH